MRVKLKTGQRILASGEIVTPVAVYPGHASIADVLRYLIKESDVDTVKTCLAQLEVELTADEK